MTKHPYKGLFKDYKLHGRNWLTTLGKEEKSFFNYLGCAYNDHGRMGGKARAKTALRDKRGRFLPAFNPVFKPECPICGGTGKDTEGHYCWNCVANGYCPHCGEAAVRLLVALRPGFGRRLFSSIEKGIIYRRKSKRPPGPIESYRPLRGGPRARKFLKRRQPI